MFFTLENFKLIFLCFHFFEMAAKISEERLKHFTHFNLSPDIFAAAI